MTAAPDPSRRIAAACVFCGANVGTRAAYVAAAQALGALLARERVALVYGGGSVGLMNEAANATLAAGGEVVGVITRALMEREVGHAGLTSLHVVDTMHERKKLMAEMSDAFVGLPGGMGTFDELVEIVTWAQLGLHAKPVICANIENYFDKMYAMLDYAVTEGFVTAESRARWRNAESVSRVMQILAGEGIS
jgi:uncharacterized protein (TIGR00730 family)